MKINKDKSTAKPIKTVIVMMAATVIAKLLGVARSMLQTYIYGTGTEANALTQASNLSFTFFDIFLIAAITGCFIPVYNSFKQDDAGKKEADDFACIFFNIILLITGLLAFLGIIFAEPIIKFFCSELNTETQLLAVKLLRIMFPMVIFVGTAYTLVGILQSKGQFIVPALMSAISNAGFVIYLVFFNNLLGENGIYGLAVTYLIAWFIQFITLLIPLIRSGFKFKFIIDFKNPNLRRTLKIAPPIMIGSSLMSFALLSGSYFTPYVGNVTVFEYSFKTYDLIVGILIQSLCNYIFPTLSKLSSHNDSDEYNGIVRTGLTTSFVIIIPFMFMVYILSGEGVSVLYLRGAFTADDAYQTASTLKLLAIAMPAYSTVEVLNRVFYSKNMTKIPMTATLCGIAVNLVSAAFLIKIDGIGVGAIGIAVAAAQIVTAVVLIIFLINKIKGVINKEFVINILKILISGIISFGVMLTVYRLIGNNPYDSSVIKNIIVMVVIFSVGAIIYISGLFITRVKVKAK